jgi:predicted dehydrogenase
MSEINPVNRRDFMMGAAGLVLAGRAAAKANKPAPARVIGANDRINIGVIGVGGRGSYVGRAFAKVGKEGKNPCQIVAVCDVYQKRIDQQKDYFAKNYSAIEGYLDYREVLNRSDVDAVIVATPDHWHARIALEAMDRGKDVYLEKPMCHTIEEARQLIDTVNETKRVLQVGSQTTSGQQWWKAKKAIADGAIGDMIMSQGSYHRNSVEGEWNWPIEAEAGPDKTGANYIDWKQWLGPAQKRPYDADRFFRFRKYWEYSGGVATDLFFHVAAPLNICWPEPQFPYKVMAGGGIYGPASFKEKREVPDTFHLIAEYAKGHSVVLTSSMANSQHIPGLIRGHKGTIIMVEHGMFEAPTDHITLKPEKRVLAKDEEYKGKFGLEPVNIPVEKQNVMADHINNFLSCMRTRQKPTLDVETAARAQVLITMSVQSYRQGKVLYFDEKKFKVLEKPPRG